MKKAFRAAIAVLFALVFAVVGLSAVMSVSADTVPEFTAENIARNGTAFADDAAKKESVPNAVNDGEYGSEDLVWQGKVIKETDANNKTEDYYNHSAGIYWASEQTFNTVVVRWKNITELKGVDYAQEGTITETTGGEEGESAYTYHTEGDSVEWKVPKKDEDYTVTRYPTAKVDVIVFASPVNANMVKINIDGSIDDGFCNKWCGEVYEIEVYNQKSVLEGIDISMVNNIALNGVASSESVGSETFGECPASNAIDGDDATYWMTEDDEDDVLNKPFILDLKSEKQVKKIRLTWNVSKADSSGFVIYVSNNGEDYTKAEEITTVTQVDRNEYKTNYYEDIIIFNEAISTRYIKLELTKYVNDNTNKVQLREFEVYGPVTTATFGPKPFSTSEDENEIRDIFVATNITEAEICDGCLIKAKYTITLKDNKKATGFVPITSAYKTITLGDGDDQVVVTAKDIGANETDYVTGVLFKNVPAGAQVTVDFTPVNDLLD